MSPFFMSRRFILPIVCFVTCAAWGRQASAWNDTGHMLTALLAWEQMDDHTRAWALGLLEQHPRFDQDFTRRMPSGLAGADRARWIFANAATWPDIARGFEGEDEARYHHSTWHYAFAFMPLDDGDDYRGRDRRTTRPTTGPTTRPATRPTTTTRPATLPSPRPGDVHIVEALNDALRRIRASDADVPAAERAVSLCWVLHLIGDIHQPCHAGSMYSDRFALPQGDRGANNILIEGEGRAGNLHAVWDGIAGDNRAMSVLTMRVERLTADVTLERRALGELRRHPAVVDWLAESAALSRDAVYDFSVRSAVRLQDLDPTAPFVPLRLSRNYASDAQMIGHRRIALAGHRICDALRAAAPIPN